MNKPATWQVRIIISQCLCAKLWADLQFFGAPNTVNRLRFWHSQVKKANNRRTLTWIIIQSHFCAKRPILYCLTMLWNVEVVWKMMTWEIWNCRSGEILINFSTKKNKLINDYQKSDCYSLNSERKKFWKVPSDPWHVSSYFWLFFEPC